MRLATTICLASLVLSIPATKASAVPIDVWWLLEGRFEGVPGTPEPGYAGGDLEVTWEGSPDGSITGTTGEVTYFSIGESIHQFFGDLFFSGSISLSAEPGMVATIDLPNRTMTLSGPASLSGQLTCTEGFLSCDDFGLSHNVPTPFDEELVVSFAVDLSTSDPLAPNALSMGTTSLGVQVGTMPISLSMTGYELQREVPEPTTGVLLVVGLFLWARSTAGASSSSRASWSRSRARHSR